jgi:HPt (histidine-containing phosphotransfer) domain-containing protein
MNTAADLVDWMQLSELIGEMNDPPQRKVLSGMWCDMVGDLERELLELDGLDSDEEIQSALHRLRGFVSMWGLRRLALLMQTIERGEEPRAEWRRQKSTICAVAAETCREIISRHPWLGSACGS